MKYQLGFFAALCAVSITSAQAQSAANARLDLTVENTPGFAWVTDSSYTATDASAAAFSGWVPSAGVFSATYGPTALTSQTAPGSAIQATSVAAGSIPVLASASTTSNASGSVSQFLASAAVTQGRAEVTSFARSYFSLTPGATVTFNGSLLLSLLGTNAALPANYATNDFYSFASGLLAVDSQVLIRELGGPLTTGMVGGYNLSDSAAWGLTVTNTQSTPLVTYLDSGITAYTVSAVPEPSAYLLALAGLLAVSFQVRRQNKSR